MREYDLEEIETMLRQAEEAIERVADKALWSEPERRRVLAEATEVRDRIRLALGAGAP